MIFSLEALETADRALDHAVGHFLDEPLTTTEMAQRLLRKMIGWSDERQLGTMALLLATAIQRLVMQKVMNDSATTGSGQLDWPEGDLPEQA